MVRRLLGWPWSHKERAESAAIEADVARHNRGAGAALRAAMKIGVNDKWTR